LILLWILEAAQGYYCNWHILNIILKKLVGVCEVVWSPIAAFQSGIWNISVPSTWWSGACIRSAAGLARETFSSFSFSPYLEICTTLTNF
jgi:hypothetical protein